MEVVTILRTFLAESLNSDMMFLSGYLSLLVSSMVLEYLLTPTIEPTIFWPCVFCLTISGLNTMVTFLSEPTPASVGYQRLIAITYMIRCIVPVTVWYHVVVQTGHFLWGPLYLLFYVDTVTFLLFWFCFLSRRAVVQHTTHRLTSALYLELRKHDTQGECPICLEEYAPLDLLLLPCSHLFHEACLEIWLRNHQTCPICRRTVHES